MKGSWVRKPGLGEPSIGWVRASNKEIETPPPPPAFEEGDEYLVQPPHTLGDVTADHLEESANKRGESSSGAHASEYMDSRQDKKPILPSSGS